VKLKQLRHQFIDEAPDQLDAGILYVSMPYRTTLNLCCCGCGNQVTLPLRPTARRLSYDGDTITMLPSVGNLELLLPVQRLDPQQNRVDRKLDQRRDHRWPPSNSPRARGGSNQRRAPHRRAAWGSAGVGAPCDPRAVAERLQ
jgi:hypothetical protein